MRIRCIQRGLARRDIRLGGIHPLGPLEDLPEEVEQEVDGDADVVCDEVVDAEGLENVEADEEGDYGEEEEGEPGEVGLHRGFEDEGVAVDALGFEGLVELDVGDQDGHPGREVGKGDEVLEPDEDGRGAGGAGEEGEERDGGGNHDAVVRNTFLGAFEEDSWGLAVLGKGI